MKALTQMSNPPIKRGISHVNPVVSAPGVSKDPQQNVRARVIAPRQLEQPRRNEPPRVVTRESAQPVTPHVRGLLVGIDGKPMRGLSQATLDAHKTQTEDATELCTRCGQMRPPAQMKTVVANALMSDNPVRICVVECTQATYKDPHQTTDNWKPSVPGVRFDRERGQPYDAKRAGVGIKDLVTKDTYHKESEVDPEIMQKTKRGVVGLGQWSGASGRVGHLPRRRK